MNQLYQPNLEMEETNMDPDRWKSVAIPMKTWKLLKEMAEKNDRSIGGEISHLTKQQYSFFSANANNYKEKIDNEEARV